MSKGIYGAAARDSAARAGAPAGKPGRTIA
jgi:hypothetical protein